MEPFNSSDNHYIYNVKLSLNLTEVSAMCRFLQFSDFSDFNHVLFVHVNGCYCHVCRRKTTFDSSVGRAVDCSDTMSRLEGEY